MGQNVITPKGEYGFENLEVTLIFENGQRHTLRTLNSIDYGNNVKRTQIVGLKEDPLTSGKRHEIIACK